MASAVTPEMWMVPAAKSPSSTPVLAAIGGDGIGPEIVEASLRCMDAAGAKVTVTRPLHGLQAMEETGSLLPDATKQQIRDADAVLFGAMDSEHGHAKPVLGFLRFELKCFANIRPASYISAMPGCIGDERCNLVIVRELTEGLYPGREGDLADFNKAFPDFRDQFGYPLTKDEGRFALRVATSKGTARIAQYAARLASHRKASGFSEGRLTVVTKRNVLPQTDGLFEDICVAQAKAIDPNLEIECLFADEAARRIVVMPEVFDTLVMPNVFGDILSDVASEIIGGLPVAPSAALGSNSAYFESCHGSAPELVGKDLANPIATLFSGAMALVHLGQGAAANRLMSATLETLNSGVKTRDLGGSAGTSSLVDAICSRLS